jgi:hypothetical protein
MSGKLTKLQQAAVDAEAATYGSAPTSGKRAPALGATELPAFPPVGSAGKSSGSPAYRLGPVEFKTVGDVMTWSATVSLGAHPVVKATFHSGKKIATASALAATTGAALELKTFEDAAARLLPGRESTSNLIQVLSIACEDGITPFNRVLMLKDIEGSGPYALHPELLTALPA